MNIQKGSFRVSPTKGLFKAILPLKLSYRLEALSPRKWLEALCLRDLDNECAEPRLHQFHRAMAFSIPSSNSNYCIDSKLCLQGDLSNKCAEPTLQRCHQEWALQDHRVSKPILLTRRALSPGKREQMCVGFSLSVMNALYKKKFRVNLSY